MQYKIEPYDWQHKAIAMSKGRGELALFAEMGTGKTGAVINIMRDKYYVEGRQLRTLILAPLVTLFNWSNEIQLHSYVKTDNVTVLHKGGSAGKLKLLANATKVNKNKIMILNYEALLANKLFDALIEWGPELVILDEAHYVKNPQAKRSKRVALLCDAAKYRFLLTGTPILNNISDIFMQFRVLDGGRTFGKSFRIFRNKYMHNENSSWSDRPGSFPKWVAREELYPALHAAIYNRAIRVTKEECLDLPPLITKTIRVELSAEQKRYYKEMHRDFVTFVKEGVKEGMVVAQLAITKALRLQQIVTGFVKTEDDDIIELADNPRLKVLKELVSSLHTENKIILWCSFRHNYKQLEQVCNELGIQYRMITGNMTLRNKQDGMDAFNNDPEVRVMIANRRAGGIGVNLVAANYSIVYSRNFSLEEELQSAARNYRGGSQIHDRIVKLDLCAMDTIDELVVDALANKKNVADTIINITKEQ